MSAPQQRHRAMWIMLAQKTAPAEAGTPGHGACSTSSSSGCSTCVDAAHQAAMDGSAACCCWAPMLPTSSTVSRQTCGFSSVKAAACASAGCNSHPLGAMRYLAVASPAFVARLIRTRRLQGPA